MSDENLYGANLATANLFGAVLTRANLFGARPDSPARTSPMRTFAADLSAVRGLDAIFHSTTTIWPDGFALLNDDRRRQ